MLKKNLAGQKFGRLFVLKDSGKRHRSKVLWECKCSCGKIVNIQSYLLTKGKTKSCGCLLRDFYRNISGPVGLSNRHEVYSRYRRANKTRNVEFNLTEDEMDKIMQGNCFYCGSVPSNIQKKPNKKHPYIYNGIDRMNNSKGYSIDNSVPCCWRCNQMKSIYSIKEFLKHVKKISDYQKNLVQGENL